MISSIFSSCSAVGLDRPAQQAVVAETGLADDERGQVGRHCQVAVAVRAACARPDVVSPEDHLLGGAAGEHGLEFVRAWCGASAPGCWWVRQR